MRNLKKLTPVISCLCLALSITGCSKNESSIDSKGQEVVSEAPVVLSVEPANSTIAPANVVPSINFNKAIDPATVTSSSFTLAQGSNIIPGTVYCNGTTASFTPSAALLPDKTYQVTATTGIKDVSGSPLASNYTWSFTTSPIVDLIAPTVIMVSPSANATSIATNIALSVTFSESISVSTVTSSSILVKQGSTVTAGNASVSGSVVTFTPTTPLAANSTYSVSVTTGVKDLAGNSLSANYSWSFTTAALADVIAPTVISVSPAVNATSVGPTSKPAITFSETINPSTVTTSSFSLKQGSATIAGSVSVSGSVATFTPASALVAGTLYTVTATTGIKDLAGNALASNYSWSFTTAAAATGKSFSADVVPVLNLCNTCHTHGWTPSTTASSFYANLLSKGYISTTAPASGKIYQMLSGGHPSGSTISSTQKSTVVTWITEGSKNN